VEVAIKKFFDDEPDELSCSTLREMDCHLSINHPHIVNVVDLYYHRRYYFLVMNLCNKGDLFDYLRERKLRIFPNKWIPQLLSAIDYLHKHNWIQRDLKTPNLLLDGDLNLKVTDFGLSRHDNFGKIHMDCNIESDTIVIGDYTPDMMTLNYRAPEMLFGQSIYDMRIDNWSVGCIIAEIYLRSYLFHGDNELRVVKNIFKQLGFPQEKDGKDPKWTKKFDNWYIWKSHFQHFDDFTLTERFEKKDVDIPSSHWHILLKLLEIDPDKRWYCHQCLDYLNDN
jgi:serine/threonine protein kinase